MIGEFEVAERGKKTKIVSGKHGHMKKGRKHGGRKHGHKK